MRTSAHVVIRSAFAWAELLFPAWILALSIDILAAGRRASPRATEKGAHR